MNSPVKIVLFGPESTGKTVLSQELAAAFNTICVPEYARVYLEKKKKYYDFYSKGSEEICTQEDILPIVLGQISLEEELESFSKGLIFFDTNALQTKVYVNYYYRTDYIWLTNLIKDYQYDHYLLTNIDIPWVPDSLRDKPNHRGEIYEVFKQELDENKLGYSIISGNFEQRLKSAKEKVKQILKNRK